MSAPTIRDALDAADRSEGLTVDLSAETLEDLARFWRRWRDNPHAQERLGFELADVIPAGAVSLHYYLKTRDPEALHLDTYERALIDLMRERDVSAAMVLHPIGEADEAYFTLERRSGAAVLEPLPDDRDESAQRFDQVLGTVFRSSIAWRIREECAAFLEWLGGEAVEP